MKLKGWSLLAVFAMPAIHAATIDNRLLSNENDGRNWAGYSRTFSEQRYSPLKQINAGNVGRLGLAWSIDVPEPANASSAPLEANGVLYFAAGYSVVYAIDARTGKRLWRYDPKTTRRAGAKLRIGWHTRGLGLWRDKVYVGTVDGRLIAINARNGKPAWSVMTLPANDARFISGPPRVFDGKVIIGHGGADYGAVRGYVTTYDAESGKQLWRFYTVPGNPAEGFENKAMEMAAKTWTGEWWKFGGGGTVWNSMTYDPEFNRVYLGTGNGSPWNRKIRSPQGGDNLFLCSIVALDADTGEYIWHYQTNPGESWDFNSAMDMVLATIPIDGTPRKVLMHAPKNGFFYVIDRETGKLISAEKIAKVTWAEKIDLATGRPVEAPNIRYESGETLIWPGPAGAHNIQPMSYSPQTGLTYIPVRDLPGYYNDKGIDLAAWRPPGGITSTAGSNAYNEDAPENLADSKLLAWNPATQQEVWHVDTPGVSSGGLLSTAGNLVFQAYADGHIRAYSADRGKLLWSHPLGVGTLSAPITYMIGRRQYVSVLASWVGAIQATGSLNAKFGWVGPNHPHRILTFALDARRPLPPSPPPARPTPVDDSRFVVDTDKARIGKALFGENCKLCHGGGAVAAGYAPDLRASGIPLLPEAFAQVVRSGVLELRGMPRFSELTADQLESLRHYLRARARETTSDAAAGKHVGSTNFQ